MTKTDTVDFTKYFDEYNRAATNMLTWVYPTELRTILTKGVDLQIETGKWVTKSMTDLVTKYSVSK